jgi:hypothetical protein
VGRIVGFHAEHIAFASAPHRHFDVADAVDRVGGDEGEWDICRNSLSIIVSASAGLVAKPPDALSISSRGTCALAIRALSSVQLLGR